MRFKGPVVLDRGAFVFYADVRGHDERSQRT